MPYDDPILKELGGYFKAEEPGRRERAEAWATAIGLQKVDGLTPSQFLFDTARDHIEGRITQNQARRRICNYYAARDDARRPDPGSRQNKAVRKKRLGKSGKKTVEAVWDLLKAHPNITLAGLVKALGVTRSTIQKHIIHLKTAGRLRRVGPDKGGHWEALG